LSIPRTLRYPGNKVSAELSPDYETYATHDYDAATYLAHHPHRVVSQGAHLQLVPTVARCHSPFCRYLWVV
jgi:hypothetical protein